MPSSSSGSADSKIAFALLKSKVSSPDSSSDHRGSSLAACCRGGQQGKSDMSSAVYTAAAGETHPLQATSSGCSWHLVPLLSDCACRHWLGALNRLVWYTTVAVVTSCRKCSSICHQRTKIVPVRQVRKDPPPIVRPRFPTHLHVVGHTCP
jgi:hypothetical protein